MTLLHTRSTTTQRLVSSSNFTLLGSSALVLLAAATTTAFALKRPYSSTRNMLATSSSNTDPNKDNSALTKSAASSSNKAGAIWDRFADGYSKAPIKDPESYQTRLDITREYFTAEKSRVLELGCGTGGTALLHAPYCRSYTATDASTRMIDIAKERQAEAAESDGNANKVEFQCLDVDAALLADSDKEYDVVLALNVLHLLPNKDEVLQRIHDDTLAPSGYFVSSTPCIGDFISPALQPFAKPLLGFLSWTGFIPEVVLFTKEELRTSLEQAGFAIRREFHPAPDKAVLLVAQKTTTVTTTATN